MDYWSFSTRSIEKMLSCAAAGSAEHQALQDELARRAKDRPGKDTGTPTLFAQKQWDGLTRQ